MLPTGRGARVPARAARSGAPAAAVLLLVIAAESLVILGWLGRVFERTDAAEVGVGS